MLRLRWCKMSRDAWLHKSRTSLVVIAVATGLIAAGSLLNAWSLVWRATAETYRASHPVSATLRVDAVDAETLAQVRALPAIAAARARRTVFATVKSSGEQKAAELYALDEFQSADIGRLESERGTWPPRDGGIVIEKSSLEFSAAAPGEMLTLQYGKSTPRDLPITGVAHDVSLPPGWMDHVVYGFVTTATLAALGAPSSLNEIQIVVRDESADRDAVRRIAYEVKALIERGGRHVANVDVPVPGQHAHAAQMNSLMLTQGAFGLLTLSVCSLLIVNLITAMLTGQTREIGVMKSLGASAGQIGAMYLGFASGLGLLATAIALPASIAIGRAYAALNASMLNFSVDGYAVPWWAVCIQLAVGCLLPVAAAALPVMRACRMPVNAALRDSGIVAEAGTAYLRRRNSIPGMSRPLQLSISNAFRRRQRLLFTLLALATGGAVYLGADNVRIAVRGSVDRLFSSQRYDLVLRFADAHRAGQIESVAKNVAGVVRAEAWNTDNASVAHADGTQGNAFVLIGLPPDSLMVAPVLQGGRWLNAADRGALVVSRSLLKDESALTPGADVTLMIGGRPTPFSVIGFLDAGPQKVAYVPRATLDALHGDDRTTTLVVAAGAHDASSPLDLILRLRSELEHAGMSVANSQALGETRRAVEDHLLMVVDFLGVMGWVMIAVGAMGLAATMSLAVLERTREIGVLRAIGAPHHAILSMIQIEGLVIAVLAWIVSIPLSMPMSWVLADAFGRVMFPAPARLMPDAVGLVSWFVMVVVVSALACAWPARRAMHIPTAAALSYE
ncbi:MAG: ABC transporter permease [Rudaea sp.]|nr:ABC transporter permease [Rudaea sp.]